VVPTSDISAETVSYFKKLPDTTRFVWCSRIGSCSSRAPLTKIVFERFYKDQKGKRPIEDCIDVISMRGLALRRCLELAKVLGKKCAALRDNDGKDSAALLADLADLIDQSERRVFIATSLELRWSRRSWQLIRMTPSCAESSVSRHKRPRSHG